MSMFKKKQKKVEKVCSPVAINRFDTEADQFAIKQPKTRIQLQERFGTNEVTETTRSSRVRLKCKDLEKLFLNVRNLLQQQLDHLLIGQPIVQTYQKLKQSQLFRIKDKSQQEINDQLSKAIQACQLLYSKLHNNQKVKDFLYVKDEQDLLLFFKHLFGKPYTVCNLPNFRKVLNTVWQHQLFQSFQANKMVDHLRQWSAGIQYPLNPAFIPLHKLVFTNPPLIKKHALLLCNNVTYCNIDGGDCMGLTPLLVAVHANRTNAYEQIIKSGANVFKCPLTVIKNHKIATTSQKGNKQIIQIHYPLTERRQHNAFQVLLFHKQYQQLINVLSQNQVYKLKKMKKGFLQINKKLRQIPDCYLQIHWKTYKGFLSFKQLPKDIITVYKKAGSLRIDYHVQDLQQTNSKPGNFSILIKTGTKQTSKLQYYLIDHTAKKIHNHMRQIHAQKLRIRYQQLSQFGNIQQQYISKLKSTSKTTQSIQTQQLQLQFCHENVSKASIYQFKTIQNYQRTLFQSDVIDYAILEKSQTMCSLKQNIGNLPKVKSKNIKNQSNFKIQWIKQKINLNHLSYIMQLIDKKSPLFLKISKVFNILTNDQVFNRKYNNKLPYKMTIDLGSQFTLQVQIKNLTFMNLDDAVFGTEFRTKIFEYQEQQVGLQSLQETMIMQENYSISMSRFLGKTQHLFDQQQQQANRKFQEMLSQQIAKSLSDQQDSYNDKKQKNIIGSDRNIDDEGDF